MDTEELWKNGKSIETGTSYCDTNQLSLHLLDGGFLGHLSEITL